MSSFGTCSLAIAGIFIALTAGRPAAVRPRATLAPAKPQVALILAIDTGYYRAFLGDRDCTASCRNLRDALHEDVRLLLARKYPFLEWINAAAPDTVHIALSNSLDYYATQLVFRIRGPTKRMVADTVTVPFEERMVLKNRSDDGWAPESLRVAWLAELEKRTFERGELVDNVFGRIPLNAVVGFRQTRAIVSPSAEEIERAVTPPSYVLRVRVKDTVDVIDDEADVHLTKCVGAGDQGYSCPIETLRFANDSIQRPKLDTLFFRNAISTRGVRLSHFKAKSVPPPTLSRGTTR